MDGDSIIVTIDSGGQHDPAGGADTAAGMGERYPLSQWREEGHSL